jgi:hypothetical protein
MAKQDSNAAFRCPFCGSAEVRRSHRRGIWERIFLRCLWLRPFRCIDCYERFYRSSRTLDAPPQESNVVANRAKLPLRELSSERANRHRVERRAFSRLSCQIPAKVVAGSGPRMAGTVSGISLNGCFMDIPHIIAVGSEIEISLEVEAGPRSRGIVRRSHPTGIAIEFTGMSVPDFRRLQNIARGSVRLV